MRQLPFVLLLLLFFPTACQAQGPPQSCLDAQQQCASARGDAGAAALAAYQRITAEGIDPATVASYNAGVNRYNEGVSIEALADARFDLGDWQAAEDLYDMATGAGTPPKNFTLAKIIFDNTYQ